MTFSIHFIQGIVSTFENVKASNKPKMPASVNVARNLLCI